MARPEDVDDGGRGEPALGQQHEAVIHEVRGLAGERGARGGSIATARFRRRVVLRGEQDLGRLLGDLATDGIDTAVKQPRRVRPSRPRRDPFRDRGPQALEPGEALRLGRAA